MILHRLPDTVFSSKRNLSKVKQRLKMKPNQTYKLSDTPVLRHNTLLTENTHICRKVTDKLHH